MLKLKKIFVLILLLSILIPVFASNENWYEGQTITSIEFEPWHFRYVGKDAAMVITEEGITLEEFWNKYL